MNNHEGVLKKMVDISGAHLMSRRVTKDLETNADMYKSQLCLNFYRGLY